MDVSSNAIHDTHVNDAYGIIDNVRDTDYDLALSVGTFENDIFHQLSETDIIPVEQELRVTLSHTTSSFGYGHE